MSTVEPTIGLALIAKNEEANLPHLLASITGHFDQVVLLDTGSTDRTVRIFQAWALENGESGQVHHFDWIGDFAAARIAADEHLWTDWTCWADCDDEIRGAQNLRSLVRQAPPELAAFVCDYDYAQHPDTGVCVCRLKRERVVRRGRGQWVGRVHEAQLIDGPTQFVDPQIVEWHHRKQVTSPASAQQSNQRNLKILRAWVKDEPRNSRVLGYLGTENAMRGNHRTAVGWFRRYLRERSDWDEERAQVHRKLSCSLIALGDLDGAQRSAYEALDVMPQWPDSHLTLAECYLHRGQSAKAVEWARMAAERGVPDTLLIINPLDYTFLPLKLLAGAYADQGRLDEAVEMGQRAMDLFPDPMLAQGMRSWKADLKRLRTADTFAMCAEQLIAHDEQMKAWVLLRDCVPHFAADHPRIVAVRALLYERIGWTEDAGRYADHYEEGGSKPEDFHASDEIVLAQVGGLPRVAFTVAELVDQMQEA